MNLKMYSSNIDFPNYCWEYNALKAFNNFIDQCRKLIKKVIRSTSLVIVVIIPYIFIIYPLTSILLWFAIRRSIKKFSKLGTTVNKDNFKEYYYLHKDLVNNYIPPVQKNADLIKKNHFDKKLFSRLVARKMIRYNNFITEYTKNLESSLFLKPPELGWSQEDIEEIKKLSKSYPEDMFNEEDAEKYDIEYNKYVLGINK